MEACNVLRTCRKTGLSEAVTLQDRACMGLKHPPHAFKKSSCFRSNGQPVPQTDTGGLVEYTKERERTLSKELGILTS